MSKIITTDLGRFRAVRCDGRDGFRGGCVTDLMKRLADEGRRRLDGVLPDGFVKYQQKNGLWVGKTPNRDLIVKCDRESLVDDALFVSALDWPRPDKPQRAPIAAADALDLAEIDDPGDVATSRGPVNTPVEVPDMPDSTQIPARCVGGER